MADDDDSIVAPKNECFLEEFKEVSEILGIVRNVKNNVQEQISLEKSLEKFTYIINQYQEQPHLLDPHLNILLDELLKTIKCNMDDKAVVHLASNLLYILTKTRGYKVIACILPHEVSDLHILLSLLSDEDYLGNMAFECKYILLLWLSIVCIIPFDLSKFDDLRDETRPLTCDIIYSHGRNYLGSNNRCQEIAALMLAKFLSRPDIEASLKLDHFITWALSNMSDNSQSHQAVSLVTGILLAFSSLLKHGRRDVMSKYAENIFNNIVEHELVTSSNSKIRKLCIKIIQRIGLTFLRPKLALWRYKRGLRSLCDNLSVDASGDGHAFKGGVDMDVDDDSTMHVPDIIEQVVEKLLIGLRDKDTTIRWSSAKGVGRLTGRLPLEMADEVVASVLELFSPSEIEDAWHGGCLCLGELGHRGLLLPRRLEEVIPLVEKSLMYDERRGTCSVGSNVRDSASFICWSFARAYDEGVLRPFMHRLMRNLVVTCLFDREVSVRKAASAALQELVGRQGNIPHGIDIITSCDYFAVGNKKNCYLKICLQVSNYEGYREPILDHLMKRKISHWDVSIRELAAEAVGLLSLDAYDFFRTSGIKTLMDLCINDDFSTRHGAILSLACVLEGLATMGRDYLDEEAISSLLPTLRERRFFRGVHGDMMRRAFCFFVNRFCRATFQANSLSLIDEWAEFLSECLHNPDESTQNSALEAMHSLLWNYWREGVPRIDGIMEECRRELNHQHSYVRRAYCLLLSDIPRHSYKNSDQRTEALGLLCQHALYYPHVNDHPSEILGHIKPPLNASTVEERRDAIKALSNLCTNIGLSEENGFVWEDIRLVYEVLFVSINDYTLDDRGDIGTCVRESCMRAFYSITHLATQSCTYTLSQEICKKMFCCLIQQSSEKIDRIRSVAGEVFYNLLHHSPMIENIPEASLLRSIFHKEKDVPVDINFASPSDTFPRFIQLLTCHEYSYHLILGMVVSAGGLTESLVKHSATSLMNQLNVMTPDQVFQFGKTLVQVFEDHLKVDRVTIPLLKTLDKLLANECFASLSPENLDELTSDLIKVSMREINKSGDVKKLLASIDVFCGLLSTSESARRSCLGQLMVFLCHRFPLIRKSCAGRFYESLVVFDELLEESTLVEVSNILIETEWDLPVEVLRPLRNNLCNILGVPAPVMVKKKLNEVKT